MGNSSIPSTTIMKNDFFEIRSQRVDDVLGELNKEADLPGTLILNAFLDSGQAIGRFVTPRSDFDYFYNAVVNSIKFEGLGDTVWVRKTVFSTEHGFSFLMFNLQLAPPQIKEHHRKWLEDFKHRS